MIHIEVAEGVAFTELDLLLNAALAALTRVLGNQDVDLSIVIENDEELRRLNKDFLGIDAPTDVLSFPADEFDPDNQSKYIGDIIISYPQAERQARTAGHPTQNELQLLAVHGVLHLLGFNHADEDQKVEMWKVQADILTEINCKINILPE